MESKLHYEIHAGGVRVHHYTGEKWSDENKQVTETIEFNVSDLPAVFTSNEGEKTLAAYGLTKLLQDRTSQVKESAAAKLKAMCEYFNVFKSGTWREYKESTGEGKGRKPQIDPILAQAVANLKKAPIAAVIAALQSKTKEERKALANLDAVKAEMAKVRAEAENFDLDL